MSNGLESKCGALPSTIKFNTATHVAAVYVVASNKEASRKTVSALNDDIYPAWYHSCNLVANYFQNVALFNHKKPRTLFCQYPTSTSDPTEPVGTKSDYIDKTRRTNMGSFYQI